MVRNRGGVWFIMRGWSLENDRFKGFEMGMM